MPDWSRTESSDVLGFSARYFECHLVPGGSFTFEVEIHKMQFSSVLQCHWQFDVPVAQVSKCHYCWVSLSLLINNINCILSMFIIGPWGISTVGLLSIHCKIKLNQWLLAFIVYHHDRLSWLSISNHAQVSG